LIEKEKEYVLALQIKEEELGSVKSQFENHLKDQENDKHHCQVQLKNLQE
jgi:hypothetical protein